MVSAYEAYVIHYASFNQIITSLSLVGGYFQRKWY